jgi:hypothetical protein
LLQSIPGNFSNDISKNEKRKGENILPVEGRGGIDNLFGY